jgi:uncharacterized membrane protein
MFKQMMIIVIMTLYDWIVTSIRRRFDQEEKSDSERQPRTIKKVKKT